MTCPDWRRLAAARDAQPGDPPGWDEALAHLDGCPACGRAAVEADPTLLFRRLPAPSVGADEVEDMVLRVSALRGAGSVARHDPRRLLPRRVASWPAAAGLAAAVLAGGHAPPLAPRPEVTPRAAAVQRALAAEISTQQPILEQLDQPYEHVVQWDADDLSVVLVVDERLNV